MQTYIFVLQMPHQPDLTQGPLSIDQVYKCLIHLLDGHKFARAGVSRGAGRDRTRGGERIELGANAHRTACEKRSVRKAGNQTHHTIPYEPCPRGFSNVYDLEMMNFWP